MAQPLRRNWTLGGISDAVCLGKLKVLLRDKFDLNVPQELPSHMIFKGELRTPALARPVHLEAFVNEKVVASASNLVAGDFQSITNDIDSILRESINIVSTQKSIRTSRAKRILVYTRTLSLGKPTERMIIIVLCDIILDLLVTEKMSKFTNRPEDLEDARIGVKIGKLKQRIPVYRAKEISDIRALRNKVVHGGSPTARSEVDFALKATTDIFDKF